MLINEWEERYRKRNRVPSRQAAPLLLEWLPKLQPGRALEIACGEGRNLLPLALAGWITFGIDASPSALRGCQQLLREHERTANLLCSDLGEFPLPTGAFDLVLNFYYLDRNLFDPIRRALRRGAYLLFETYTKEHLACSPRINPDFLLQTGELPKVFGDLTIDHYEELTVTDSEGHSKAIGRLVAHRE